MFVKFLRVTALMLLFAAGYHLSGIELSFCNDEDTTQYASHGCQTCQPSGHSAATFESANVNPAVAPDDFLFNEQAVFRLQEPSHSFFRPPINR